MAAQDEAKNLALSQSRIIDDDDEDDENEANLNLGGDPRWLVTFGDTISLLVTFFVLLLSFSTFEESESVKQLTSFFSRKLSTGESFAMGAPFKRTEINYQDTDLERIMNYAEESMNLGDRVVKDDLILTTADIDNMIFTLGQIEEMLDELIAKSKVDEEIGNVEKKHRYLITFDPGIYFEEHEDVLTEEGIALLKKTGLIFSQLPNDVIITGYADDAFELPPQQLMEAQTNLAIARADRIAQHLIRNEGVQPERILLTLPSGIPGDGNLKKATIGVAGSLDGFYITLKKEKMGI